VTEPLIAIDGPAGSGKSTLASRLAAVLGVPYLNTGLMYRAVTLRAVRDGIDPGDAPALADLAASMRFELDHGAHPPVLSIDGEAPDPGVTSPQVESRVSLVARHPEVRSVLRAEQRRLCEGGGVVEGRDIGSVVAPHADVKIYLEAEEARRIARRAGERPDAVGETSVALPTRDAIDARTNPFVPAPDAIVVDTTDMGPDLVFETVLTLIRRRLAEPS
jgi:cytidylate kinase